jgi:hypothetical protein
MPVTFKQLCRDARQAGTSDRLPADVRGELKELLDSGYSDCNLLQNAASQIAANGVARVLDGDDSGWSQIKRAWRCEALGVRYDIADSAAGLSAIGNEVASFLSLGFVLGYETAVAQFLQPILQAVEDGLARDWRFDSYGGFMMRLLARRFGAEKQADSTLQEILKGPYEDVFRFWDQPAKLKPVLKQLCDYHMEGTDSHDPDERAKFGHWEFIRSPYQLLPAEFLCIQRIRQDFSLKPVAIPHPLIRDNPLARAPAKIRTKRDAFLDELESGLAEYWEELPELPSPRAVPKVQDGLAPTLITIESAWEEREEEKADWSWPSDWPEQKALSQALKLLGCNKDEADIDGLIEDEPADNWWEPFANRLEQSESKLVVVFDWKETHPPLICEQLAKAAAAIDLAVTADDENTRPVLTYKNKRHVWKGRSRKHDAFVAGFNAVIAHRGEFFGIVDLDGKGADAYGYCLFSPGRLSKVRKRLGQEFDKAFRKIGKKADFKAE